MSELEPSASRPLGTTGSQGRDHYTYRVSWSPRDAEHVGTCIEFPSLSWLANDEFEALRGIKRLVRETAEDLRANGETVPVPLADQEFSGEVSLRLTSELHRQLAILAAEARVSLDRYISARLAATIV